MALSLRTRRRLLTWLAMVAFGGVAGHLYGIAIYSHAGVADHIQWYQGARAGMMIAAAISGLELFFIFAAPGAALRRLPFLQLLGIRVLAHTAIVNALLLLNATIGIARGEAWADGALAASAFVRDTVFSFGAFSVALFFVQMRNLIGGRALRNVVLGRYYQPQREDRLFLLLDVKGSTALAVQMGDAQYHRFLATVFFDIDAPITEHGGEIYEYAGDAVIASWPLARAHSRRNAIEAVFSAKAVLRGRARRYEESFGALPVFRAVLHSGPVVVGECGDSKRQIVYRGETLNTVARLEGLAKELGKDMLATVAVEDGALPADAFWQDMGAHQLRGLPTPLHVFALQTRDG